MSDEQPKIHDFYGLSQIAAALAAAQAEYKPAVKNATNPHFKNTYADLTSIIDATRDALTKHGLAFTQSPKAVDGRVVIVSRLIHKSGQVLENEVSLKAAQDTPQGYGSTITYGRRYGAQCLLGINGEPDDDGQSGSTKAPDNPDHVKRIGELEKMLEHNAAAIRNSQRLNSNIDSMLWFYEKFTISHADLVPLCQGRNIKDWNDRDLTVLRNAGVQLTKGVPFETILETAGTPE